MPQNVSFGRLLSKLFKIMALLQRPTAAIAFRMAANIVSSTRSSNGPGMPS
jgi:hypothetical protein